MYQNPYHMNNMNNMSNYNPQLKQTVLSTVEPFVQYGLKEAKMTSYPHVLRELAAISYLMGMGYNPNTAYRTVESWEINEVYY